MHLKRKPLMTTDPKLLMHNYNKLILYHYVCRLPRYHSIPP